MAATAYPAVRDRTTRAEHAPDRARSVELPILGESIEDRLAAERRRLMQEAGLDDDPIRHFRRPEERRFTRDERDRVTIWFGGLTLRHEQLIHAALEGLGYQVGLIPTPEKADFQAGKEYGNNGQCNPTYFTVGALVNHLKRMRDDDGLPTETILRDNVFITAGACGPCRFGMYEAEYRLALRNSGFDGFRVLLFQQQGGLDQAAIEAGLEFNLPFFLGVLNATFIGDLLNEIAYQIRPYEVMPGQTDEVFARCMDLCCDALRSKKHDVTGGMVARLLSAVGPVSSPADAHRFIEQLRGSYYTGVLEQCRAMIDEIDIDYTRAKPVVKITGEFWAQTTEGDGNFRMFPFLEEQGAEVLVEPIATWITYLLHQAEKKTRDRAHLTADDAADGTQRASRLSPAAVKRRAAAEIAYRKKLLTLRMADRIIGREYNRYRRALGNTAHELANQLELTRLGHPYYNSRSGGGEGHLEVAKNIYYMNKDMAHMVLSLKPFGCMPSTQSDGAQAAVNTHFKDMLYLPIETSGEGDVNAHSRVQMALGEAKAKCKEEFKAAVAQTSYTVEQIRAFASRADNRHLRRPLRHVTHHKGIVSKAANFVLDVGEQMQRAGVK